MQRGKLSDREDAKSREAVGKGGKERESARTTIAKPEANARHVASAVQTQELVVTAAAADGAKIPPSVIGFEYHARIIRQAARGPGGMAKQWRARLADCLIRSRGMCGRQRGRCTRTHIRGHAGTQARRHSRTHALTARITMGTNQYKRSATRPTRERLTGRT